MDILSPPTPPQVRNEGEGEEESFVCVGRYSSATSISSDDLLRTFEMVETPEQSVRSLASNDSLHQPPSLPAELEEDEGEYITYPLAFVLGVKSLGSA